MPKPPVRQKEASESLHRDEVSFYLTFFFVDAVLLFSLLRVIYIDFLVDAITILPAVNYSDQVIHSKSSSYGAEGLA